MNYLIYDLYLLILYNNFGIINKNFKFLKNLKVNNSVLLLSSHLIF